MQYDFSPCQTPHKHGKWIIESSMVPAHYKALAVDCPFPFTCNGKLYMTTVVFDGEGYQTALWSGSDYLHWNFVDMIVRRDPERRHLAHNAALTNILREPGLYGMGELVKVGGRYLGTYHAYPNSGYEAGPAMIGLAWSDDLLHWELDDGILFASDGAEWECGGLYKSSLFEKDGRYYLFYNAKTATRDFPWREQTGLAWSDDLKHWTRCPENPLLKNGPAGSCNDLFASDPQVFSHDGVYYCFHFGLSSDPGKRATELIAASRDLIHWTPSETPLLVTGAPGEIDDKYAHKPGIIADPAGTLYHYYCAVSENQKRGIALAFCSKTPSSL